MLEKPYRKGTVLERHKLHILNTNGGIGDFICRFPVFLKLVTKYPQITAYVYFPAFFLETARFFLKHPNIIVKDRGTFLTDKFPGGAIIPLEHETFKTMAVSLMQYAHLLLFSELMPEDEAYYPEWKIDTLDVSKFGLPRQQYVVLTTEATSATRTLKASTLLGLAEYFKSKNIPIVFLGKKEITKKYIAESVAEFDYSVGMDLREKTTILEATEILAQSRGVLGLDNGLLHLASCTPAAVVFGFSTVRPEHRLCGRRSGKTVVVEPTGDCTYCQSKIRFVRDFKFNKCFYDDFKCLDTLTAERFIEAWEKL